MAREVPNSYKDPYWQNLAEQAEVKTGIPSGLLRAIINQGERSNNNQVSEAGARSPFQIIPATRDAIVKKYGIDPYASPEEAAEGAALLLKEGLDRNRGSITETVGEYHGGIDRKNWGPRTKAYIQRVSAVPDQQSEVLAKFNAWKAERQANAPVVQSAQADPANQESDVLAKFNAWKASKQQVAQPKIQSEQPGIIDRIGRQVGLTARAGIEGLVGLPALIADPAIALANMALPESMQQKSMTQATSDLLTSAGLPIAGSPEERIVQSIGSSVSGAGGLIAGGARLAANAASPAARAAGEFLAAQPGAQLAGTGAASAAQQSSAESGADVLGQFAAGVGGALLGGKAASMKAPVIAKEQPKIVQQAKQANIPLMTSDVVQPTTFLGKSAQAAGERIPIVGTGGLRSAQEEARQAAIKKLVVDYGADSATPFDEQITKSVLSKRSEEITKNVNLKADVFDKMQSKGAVPLPSSMTQIDKELAEIKSLGPAAPTQVVKILEDFKESLGQGSDIKKIESLRKLLGDQLQSPDLASARSLAEKIPSRVYGALKKDMGEFIKQNGDSRDYAKWRIADRNLSQMMGELSDTKLKAVLKSGESSPETINRMLFSKQPSDVKRLYNSLDEKGRQYAKAAIIKRAFDESITDNVSGSVSTIQFGNKLRKLSSQSGIIFSKDDLDRINGLNDVLEITKRASTANVMTATGQQAYVPIAAAGLGSLFGNFFGALAAAGTVGGIARAYESAPVRNFLIKLGSSTGKEKQNLLDIAKRQIIPAIQSNTNTQEKN